MDTETTVPPGRLGHRPDWAVLNLMGLPHLLHLRTLRRALLARALRGPDAGTLVHLAQRVGCSRSTMSRLFAGKSGSPGLLADVLEALELEIDEVCWPLDGDLLARVMEGAVVLGGAVVPTVDPLRLPGAEHIRPARVSLAPPRTAQRLLVGAPTGQTASA